MKKTAVFAATALFLLTQGCSRHTPPEGQTEAITPADSGQTPILPAIDADVYSVSPTEPRDVLVVAAASGLEWDESLSGAAANLAIDLSSNTPIDAASVRWAGLKSGWPYPITYAGMELVAHQTNCPPSLLENIPSHSHVGIARARGAAADAWVVLSTDVQRVAEPFSNSQELNTVFGLPFSNSEGLSFRAFGATGEMQSGSSVTFDHEGEWVIEVIDDNLQSLLLRAAIYVDGESPDYAPIEAVSAVFEDIDGEILSMVNEVRAHFVDGYLNNEPLLTSTARRSLQAWMEEGTPSPPHDELGTVTLTGTPTTSVICVGETPRACIDQIYWSAQQRGALLNANLSGAGVASQIVDGRIHAVIHLAGQ